MKNYYIKIKYSKRTYLASPSTVINFCPAKPRISGFKTESAATEWLKMYQKYYPKATCSVVVIDTNPIEQNFEPKPGDVYIFSTAKDNMGAYRYDGKSSDNYYHFSLADSSGGKFKHNVCYDISQIEYLRKQRQVQIIHGGCAK